VIVSYETVRQWRLKFGASFAEKLHRRRPRPGDKWHLDEAFIRIRGVPHYLRRAVEGRSGRLKKNPTFVPADTPFRRTIRDKGRVAHERKATRTIGICRQEAGAE
jgi:hypothetical protein